MVSVGKRILGYFPVARTFASETTPYHCGRLWENRLGYQVLRMLTDHLARKFKRYSVSSDMRQNLEIMERDGILVLENFLSPSRFESVKQEAAQLAESINFRPLRNGEAGALLHGQIARLEPKQAPLCTSIALEEPLKQLVSAVIGHKISEQPQIFIDHFKRSEDTTAVNNDIESLLHADLHLPTVKAWLFLEPVTMANGPFYFAKGSHRLGMKRLAHEYRKSVLTIKLRQGHGKIPEHLKGQRGTHERIILEESEYNTLNIQESPITGPANTLVIANTMGFHRRGDFEPGNIRKWILFNYRRFSRGWS